RDMHSGRRRAARRLRSARWMLRRGRRRVRMRPSPARRRPRQSDFRASRGSAARGRGRWGSFGVLRAVEVPVLLVERERGELPPLFAREPLGRLDSSDEALRRLAQGKLGIGAEPPRDVDTRKEHVADLLRRALRVVEIASQLGQLVVEVGKRALGVRILEADSGGALLHLAREDERGLRARDAAEETLVLPDLDSLPVLADTTCGSRFHVAEDVGRAPDELLVDPARDLLEVTLASLLEQE